MFSKLKTFIQVMRLYRTLKENGGIRICTEAQAQELFNFIEYRAQLALYELHKDIGAAMSWDDFISFVRKSSAIRNKIPRVMGYAITHFDVKQLDFELPVITLAYQEDIRVEFTRIFSDKLGHSVIEFLFIQFEMEHFKRLAAVTPHYTWKSYMNDLSNKPELWNKFSRGFQHGLQQLDFKESWRANATQDEILRLEFQERET